MIKDIAVQNQKAVALRDYMQGDNIKNQLASALPKWLSTDRLLRIVFTSVMKNPKLLECTRESILSSVMQCAQLGLEPILGRSYLIPYENSKRVEGVWIKVPECQMQIGYQGLVDLARRTDTIADVWGANVYENDEFTIQYGMDRDLNHIPWFMNKEKRDAGEPGKVIGAYVVWKLKDSTMHPEFMSIIDIHKRRDKSQSFKFAHTGDPKKGGGKKNSIWHEWPEEMNLKTVIKFSSKLIPASIEFMQAVEIDNAADSGMSTTGYFENEITLPDPGPAKQIETKSEPAEKSDTPKDTSLDELQNDSIKKQFVATFGDPDENMQKFLEGTAKMNETTVKKIMQSAIDNKAPFAIAFKNWKKQQTPETAGPVTEQIQTKEKENIETENGDAVSGWSEFVKKWVRLHGDNFKKFVADNQFDFDRAPDWVREKAQKKYMDLIGETWPSKVSAGQGENVQSDTSEAVDLMQTDEWNEISMLQERYPDIYSRLAKGLVLKSVANLTNLILDINAEVESERGGGTQKNVFDQSPGTGDIPT